MPDLPATPNMPEPYVPISCDVHDQLLALASLRKECEITVLAEGKSGQIRGTIMDVYSRAGAEYLQMKDGSVFRLDQIEALNGRPIRS